MTTPEDKAMEPITDDQIFHRLICAWNGRDPAATTPLIGPANEITKQGWLRVYHEALACSALRSRIEALEEGGRDYIDGEITYQAFEDVLNDAYGEHPAVVNQEQESG